MNLFSVFIFSLVGLIVTAVMWKEFPSKQYVTFPLSIAFFLFWQGTLITGGILLVTTLQGVPTYMEIPVAIGLYLLVSLVILKFARRKRQTSSNS